MPSNRPSLARRIAGRGNQIAILVSLITSVALFWVASKGGQRALASRHAPRRLAPGSSEVGVTKPAGEHQALDPSAPRHMAPSEPAAQTSAAQSAKPRHAAPGERDTGSSALPASQPAEQPTAPKLITLRRAIAVTLLAFLGGGALIGVLGTAESDPANTDTLVEGSGSAKVVELQERFPAEESATAIVVFSADNGTLDAATLQGLRTGGSPFQVSEDKTAAISVVPLEAVGNSETSDAVKELRSEMDDLAPDGVTAQVTGPAAIQADLGAVFEGADFRLHAATATVVAVLLLFTYRSPILWLIPLITIGVGDRTAVVVATQVLSAVDVAFDESTTGILSVLVFGAGTDYALLLISRYRDELRTFTSRYAAMSRAVVKTSEAVFSSATTVVLGVLTLLLSVIPSTRGLGLASAVGIVVAVVFALVALPCVLVLFGRWVFWPQVPKVGQAQLVDSHSLWRRIGDAVAKKPSAFIAGALVLLIVMGLGLTQVKTGLSQTDQFLDKPEAISAAERIGESFPAGSSDPVIVITEGSGESVKNTAERVANVDSARVGDTSDGLTRVDVILDADPSSEEAVQAIRDLRTELDAGSGTFVGGSEAQSLDSAVGTERDRALIIPLILVLVFVALIFLLRSVVAPIILVSTVVATFFAALGASWWLFTIVFGFEALDDGAPLLAFLFLVALGVDYNIFLVTRAWQEAKVHGSHEGMIRGLTATGGVIKRRHPVGGRVRRVGRAAAGRVGPDRRDHLHRRSTGHPRRPDRSCPRHRSRASRQVLVAAQAASRGPPGRDRRSAGPRAAGRDHVMSTPFTMNA